MSTSSCSFSSIDTILVQAITKGLNITDFVASCPNVCTLAWGTGNPDLSGIGLNISYITQNVLMVFCGPLFFLIYTNRRQLHLDKTTIKNLLLIHDNFLDTSAALNIPVAIAALIRMNNSPPLYEMAFLEFVTFMQATTLLPVAVIVGLFKGRHRRSAKRVAVITLYVLLAVGLCVGFIELAPRNAIIQVLGEELIHACKPHSRIGSILGTILDQGSHFRRELGWHIGAGLSFLVVLVVLVMPNWRRRRWILTAILLIPLTAQPLMVAVNMQHARLGMRAIVGNDFQDDQWGFGQIIAVFIWAPLCARILFRVLFRVLILRLVPPGLTNIWKERTFHFFHLFLPYAEV